MVGMNAAERTGAEAFAGAMAMLGELKTAREAATPRPPKIPKVSEIRLSKFSGKPTDWVSWRSEVFAKVSNGPCPF